MGTSKSDLCDLRALIKRFFILTTLFLTIMPFAWAETHSQVKNKTFLVEPIETVDIYLDCQTQGCHSEYIRNELTFLNYVRDKTDADIHLQINSENNGSGREYTLTYYGKGTFNGRENQIRFFSSNNTTNDERRQKLLRYLKIGIAPYLINTDLVDNMNLTVEQQEEDANDANTSSDGWNYWVYEISGSTFFDGSDTQESFSLDGEISADRITPNWKIRMETEGGYEYNWFELSDGRTTTTEVRDQSFEGLFARAISPHWSVGLFTEAESSTYDNYKINLKASPAVEYNLFDYQEYGERELRLMYRMSSSYAQYLEETIYQQNAEMLYNHELSLDLDINRQWGRIRSSASSSHYLHDFNMNRLKFYFRLDLRLFRGLSLNLRGDYNLINDQLSIPAGDASDEEVLLNIREQATDFSYWGRIGLSYTFGSLYNNIVNPRF